MEDFVNTNNLDFMVISESLIKEDEHVPVISNYWTFISLGSTRNTGFVIYINNLWRGL